MTETRKQVPIAWPWLGISVVVLGLAAGLSGFVPGIRKHFFGVETKKVVLTREVRSTKEMRRIDQELDGVSLTPGSVRELSSGGAVEYRDGRMFLLEDTTVLFGRGKMIGLLWTAVLLFLAGLGLGALSRRKMAKEVVVASAFVMLGMLGTWAVRAGGAKLLTAPLFILSNGVLVRSPPALFVLLVGTLILLLPAGGTMAGHGLVKIMTGQETCPSCGERYLVVPDPPTVCPACGADLTFVGRFRWGLVVPAILLTQVVYVGAVRWGGSAAGFYYRCDFSKPSDRCLDGVAMAREASKKDSHAVLVWRSTNKQHHSVGVVLHQWKYIGFLSILFLFGPLVVAWRGKSKGLASAGLTLVLNWVGAFILAMTVLGFGQFEGVVLLAIRIHVVAGLLWCLAGAIGAVIGHRLQAGSAFDDAMEKL
ncbi:MAG: hypothetical protein J7M25_11295 [Deltaproteobacteria bacterium]|nr:hypothetical protein [Deltaproteobacteria bacterium]